MIQISKEEKIIGIFYFLISLIFLAYIIIFKKYTLLYITILIFLLLVAIYYLCGEYIKTRLKNIFKKKEIKEINEIKEIINIDSPKEVTIQQVGEQNGNKK